MEIWQETLPNVLPITVTELANYMRIDDDMLDSDELTQLIYSATQKAEHILGREIIGRNSEDSEAICSDAASVPYCIKQYLLMEAGETYKNRENTDSRPLATYFDHLLDPYIIFKRD